MKTLYFHGGPGLNSNPEKHLIGPDLARAGFDVVYWNEPSTFRPGGAPFQPSGAYENYLHQAELFFLEQSGECPVLLIGHSFGAHAVAHLGERYPEKTAGLIYISPDLSIQDADLNMFRFIQQDFQRAN